MNLKTRSYFAFAVLATASLYSNGAFAQGQGLGQLATSWQTGTLGPLANFAGALAFLAGVVIGIIALLKFKAHSSNPNDPSAKLSSAFTLVFVAAALIGLPMLLGVGVTTLFGSTGQTTSIGGTLQGLGG